MYNMQVDIRTSGHVAANSREAASVREQLRHSICLIANVEAHKVLLRTHHERKRKFAWSTLHSSAARSLVGLPLSGIQATNSLDK